MAGSAILFPLRSNAASLVAGAGVASVRRRILVAALLHDQVLLQAGVHVAWAGPDGGSSITIPDERPDRWQSTRDRARRHGSRHFVRMQRQGKSTSTPARVVVSTEASYSWRASFMPFRRELPASAAKWLHVVGLDDVGEARALVRDWESTDRLARLRRNGLKPASAPPEGIFVRDGILKAGYADLAAAALAGVAVSVDRRHQVAVNSRLVGGDAQRVVGHHALEILLPVSFTWHDVPALRADRGLRSYASIVRDIEVASLETAGSLAELEDHVVARYLAAIAKASERIGFAGRASLALVGFVAGEALNIPSPIVGGAVGAIGSFAAGEAIGVATRPRWLSVHRRISRRTEGI